MDASPRAVRRDFASDAILVRTGPDGLRRYFLAEDPTQEFSYRRPYILELEITRRCNLRCVHCYARAEDRPFDDELTFDELVSVLDQGRALGIRELSLTGGEVFVRRDFVDVIDAGLDRGYDVRFVTNATLLDQPLLRALCARPIKLITASLDAMSTAAHEAIRGPGSHRPARDAIDRLLDAGFPLSVITAFSRLNIGDFDALFEFCVRRRIDWQVQMTSAKGRCPQEITFSPAEYYAFGERVARAIASRPPMTIVPMDDVNTFSHFAPLSALSRHWQRGCMGGLLNLFVRANGDVTPCSALAFPACIVGNVRRDPLRAVCEEERCRHNLEWLRPETLTGQCATCPFRAECRGGCPEILLSMCRNRTENEYCYHRIESERIVAEALPDA